MPGAQHLAIAGDFHLKHQLLTSFRDIHGDTYYSLKQVVDWCLANRADLIIPGDFFDSSRQTSENFSQGQSELMRLRDAGLNTYWITGNHDRATPAGVNVVDGSTERAAVIHEVCPSFDGNANLAGAYTWGMPGLSSANNPTA
jgi:metallophosphoesterase superfamily enzyme